MKNYNLWIFPKFSTNNWKVLPRLPVLWAFILIRYHPKRFLVATDLMWNHFQPKNVENRTLGNLRLFNHVVQKNSGKIPEQYFWRNLQQETKMQSGNAENWYCKYPPLFHNWLVQLHDTFHFYRKLPLKSSRNKKLTFR